MIAQICRALLIVLLVTPVARAEDMTHLAKPGDSFRSLSKNYYGQDSFEHSLRLYNEMSEADLTEGAVVRVPFAQTYTVKARDTWSSLANVHWGNRSLFVSLAELVPESPETLRTGDQISIPALIPYRVERGQTFASLSRLAYDSSAQSHALARLNKVNPRSLRQGQIVRIPLLITPPESAPQAPAPVAAAPTQSRYLQDLELGADALAAANFAFALDHFEELRDDVLENGDHREQTLLLQQLVVLYVAFDQPSETCEAYRLLRRLEPALGWDTDLTSPKVIRMTRGC